VVLAAFCHDVKHGFLDFFDIQVGGFLNLGKTGGINVQNIDIN